MKVRRRTMLRTQIAMEQRMFWRNGSSVFFTFLFPLLLLGFAGAFAPPEVIVPGIAALAVMSTCFQSLCIQLAFHREQGILKRLAATPLPPSILVGGKVLTTSSVALLEIVFVGIMGKVAFGFDAPHNPLLLLVSIVLGAVAFSALAFCIASLSKSGDTAPAFANALQLPLMFISGVFYSVDKLPGAVEYVAGAFPLLHLVEAVRIAWDPGASDPVAIHLLVLALWGIGGVVVAARTFRWEPAHES